MKRVALLFVGACVAGSAHATIFEFMYPESYTTGTISQGGGSADVTCVMSMYDTATQTLSFETNVLDTAANRVNFFSLALSPGANPNGHPGQVAMLYFDATRAGTPVVTAYGYNGTSSDATYAGTPDKIASTANGTLGGTASATRNGDMATFRFTIPAAAINAHSPAIPNPTAPWTGVRFADSVGIWFHTRSNATTTYGADGYLTNLRYNEFHWLDGSNLNTMVTPEPMSLAALGMGAAALLRRKKK